MLQIRSCQFLLAAFSAAHALESSEMLDPWTNKRNSRRTKFHLDILMKLPRIHCIHCIKLFPWLERLTNFEHAALWKMQRPSHTKSCWAVPSDQAAARPFFELLFFNFDSWSFVRLQAEQLAIRLYETHFGESLDTNSMSAWRWNCDWSYLFIFVISNHSDFLSIIDIKFLSLTIQSSDWQL